MLKYPNHILTFRRSGFWDRSRMRGTVCSTWRQTNPNRCELYAEHHRAVCGGGGHRTTGQAIQIM